MAYTFDRHFTGAAATGGDFGASISAADASAVPTVTGRLAFAAFHWNDPSNNITISGVTDNVGSTWVPCGPKRNLSGDASRQIWMTRLGGVSTTYSVTAALSASTNFKHGVCTMFSTDGTGLSVTTEVIASGASGNAVSPTYSTSSAEQLVYMIVYGGTPMTAGGGLTKAGGDQLALAAFHRYQASAASGLSETATPNGGGWGLTLIAFDTLANSGVSAPVITAQPTNQTVTAPNSATFSVTATGDSLAYQWRLNGTNIGGANSATYNTGATTTADTGKVYSVVVSNGGGSVTSNNATLTVNAAADTTPPTLTGTIEVANLTSTSYQITSPVATDNVAVTGYQYRINGGTYLTIAGGNRFITVTGRTPGATDAVDMRAFDAAGNFSTAISTSIDLNAAPVITVQPTNQTVTAPTAANFSITATGTTLSYQWQRQPGGTGGFTDIVSATSNTFSTGTTSVTGGNANNTDQYRCRVTDSGGISIFSSAVTLTVNAGSDTVAPTQTGTITVSNLATTTYTLSWPAGTDNIAVTGYELSLNGGSTYTDVGNVLTFNVTGRTANTDDLVRVRAYDAGGNRSNPPLAVTVRTRAGNATALTGSLENLSGSLLLGASVRFSYFPGGRIGALDGIRPVEGTATSNATNGTVLMQFLPTGPGLAVLSTWGATTADDTVSMQYVTAS